MVTPTWSEEGIEALKQGLADGKSFGMIATELGATRNSVIGKAFRLGLRNPALRKGRPKTIGTAVVVALPQARTLPRPNPRALIVMKPIEDRRTEEVSAPPLEGRLGAQDAHVHLQSNMCRWPIGDPREANFHFCCKPAKIDSPQRYCVAHAAIHGSGASWVDSRARRLRLG